MTHIPRKYCWRRIASLVVALTIITLANGCAIKQRVHPPPPRPEPTAPSPVPRPEVRPEIQPELSVPPAEQPAPDKLSPPPPAYVPRTGPAKGLYSEAEKALASGQAGKAEMLMERALRIEPRNAHYWHTLARIKHQQAQYAQTIQFCLKSNSLATGQPQLTERNNQLLQQAKNKN